MTPRTDGATGRGDGATGRDGATRPLCTTCKGRGWVYSAMDLGGDKDCPTCKGSGRGATAQRNSDTTYEGDTT